MKPERLICAVSLLLLMSSPIAVAQDVPPTEQAPASAPVELGPFHWQASEPLLELNAAHLPASPDNPWFAVKDPTIVRHDDRWHLFCTLRKRNGGDGKPPGYIRVGYLSFATWADAQHADWRLLDLSMDYHGAPQVFFFEPHNKWYLVYQLADATRGIPFGPCYSTSEDISDPTSWTPPQPMYPTKPDGLKVWLDFWVICDDAKAHLFFTSLNGKLWRAETKLEDFPDGFSKPEIALQGKFFEASNTYRLEGSHRFLTLIEAEQESNRPGRRFFKAWLADRLEGPWKELATTPEQPFAGTANVDMPANAWTDSVSHGELIRSGTNQNLEIDPRHLRLLFQGVSDDQWSQGYGKIRWRLGILTATEP